MASSDSNVDVAEEMESDERPDSDDEPLELDPDEVLETNPSAKDAFSPE